MQFVGTEMSHDDNSVAACPPDRLVHGMSRRKDNDRENENKDHKGVCKHLAYIFYHCMHLYIV